MTNFDQNSVLGVRLNFMNPGHSKATSKAVSITLYVSELQRSTASEYSVLINNDMSTMNRFSSQHANRMDLDHVMTWYVYPIITGFGCLGNILAFLVLLRRKLRRRTTCLYMIVMAVADFIMLTSKFLLFLTFYVLSELTSVWLCKSVVTLHLWSTHVSVLLLITMTTEKYVSSFTPKYI